MEWINELLGVGANVASGGLFGLFGSLLGVGAKYLQAKQSNSHKLAEWEHEIALRKLTMEAGDRETENELAIARSEGSWRGLEVSHQSVIAAGSVPVWANAIRSLFRPALTTGLIIVSILVFWWIWSGVNDAEGNVLVLFSETDIKDIVRYMVYSLFFASTTSVVWWFGDRAMTPPNMKAR